MYLKAFINALVVFSSFLFFSPAVAQTPDQTTPANEGVCDELLYGATKGLYGLCVAFCEAQDCEPDFSLDNPFENCKTGSKKVLSAYNKKKRAGDPEMPCIQQTECPCWTQSELEGLRFPVAGDVPSCRATQSSDSWFISGSHLTIVSTVDQSSASDQCFLFDICPDGQCMGVVRYLDITEEEYAFCRSQVIQSGRDRGFACWDQ